jgi:hypothetical protein
MQTFRLWLILTLLGVAALTLAYFATQAFGDPPNYDAMARSRPTCAQAHTATHIVLGDFAEVMGGHVVVGPCAKRGKYSTICRVRVVGRLKSHYRILVTGTRNGNFLVTGLR